MEHWRIDQFTCVGFDPLWFWAIGNSLFYVPFSNNIVKLIYMIFIKVLTHEVSCMDVKVTGIGSTYHELSMFVIAL